MKNMLVKLAANSQRYNEMSLETMLKWRFARAVKVDLDTIAHNKSMVYYITTISRLLNRVNIPQVKTAFTHWRK